jgi:uncharacterized protein
VDPVAAMAAAGVADVAAVAVVVAAEVNVVNMLDRVGLAWREELAGGIVANLDKIDVVEVIAEDYFRAPQTRVRALQTLARQVPVYLHGVSMGLASSIAVEQKNVEAMARLVNAVEPVGWSEHLAFVRAGGVEIGHLAAPPRSAEVIENTLINIATAANTIGALPQLENIATLISPPCSTMDEGAWTSKIIRASGAPLMLDLHNLYANALNFNLSPQALLASMPLDCVQCVHLSGGVLIDEPGNTGKQRLLDDHIHDVPDEVFVLLTALAARAAQPLTVIVERDGAYPPFAQLLAQLARAREALATGRAQLRLAKPLQVAA